MKRTKICKSMLHRMVCAAVACTVAVSFTAAVFADTATEQQVVLHPAENPSVSGLTAQQLAEGLGRARQYGVVADTLENDTDFETNVAVNTLTGSNGELGNTHDMTLPAAATLTVHTTAPAGSYLFGVFTDTQGKQQVGDAITVTTDTAGNGTAAVQNLTAGQTYAVMPLQNGKPDTAHAKAVVIPQTADSLASGAVSYVGSVQSAVGALTLKSVGGAPSQVVFGQGNTLSGSGGQRALQTADGKAYTVNLNNGTVSVDDGTQNPDVNGMLSSLSAFAGQLSGQPQNLTEDASVKVLQLSSADGSAESLKNAVAQALGYSDSNKVQNDGISLDAQQYLVLNVQTSAQTVSLPEVKIGGVNPGDNWNSISSRVIWNLGTYSGTVHTAANAGTLGTLLAPDATVAADGSSMNGPVYAKTVLHTSGGEIHRIPFQVSNTADVFFVGKTEEVPVSSGSSSFETPSQESSTPASNGTGSIPSDSAQSSSSETPSQESSTPASNGTGSIPSDPAQSSSSETPSQESSTPASNGTGSIPSSSTQSSSSETPSQESSTPASNGTGSVPSSSTQSSSSETPSQESSTPTGNGTGSVPSSSTQSSSSETPSQESSTPASNGTGSIPSSSSESSSSETPSQESSTPTGTGTGSIPSSSSESSSSETPSQESSTPTGNGAGTLSSETASTGSDSPSATVETAHKLPQTGTDIVPVLVSVAGGSAVMLYGVLELLRSRGRKKHE
ncbi:MULTISPECIES: collagen-binding domain-containing protein [Caproicibacterium]|uniref:Collagen-binding domain-containing protein n=1 Tax=Caproicibacterium argilliputei TaxID=3030016 RepID=A0AA97DA37_9FIRM|nr:collagen-binding domain-containing protein [Caproicibacterium argilliputei]WOC31840.1 collagen-binding domain-containing protein [Caproicibacterium argilliputei]